MDGPNFDDLSRRVGTSLSRRRALWSLGGVLGGLAAALPDAPDVAGKKKRKKKKKKKKGERCGSVRCRANQLCCDPANGVCCSKRGASCCNPGPGTGACCAGPNRCGRPWGNDAAPFACCPPERQWFTSAGLVRCCPPGTKSMGTGITTNGGPCCPEANACGKTCCNTGQVCADPATGRCCSEAAVCGKTCCLTEFCMACVNGTCQDTCPPCHFCNGSGACIDCGEGCCGG